MSHKHSFQIDQLRKERIAHSLETIVLAIFAFMAVNIFSTLLQLQFSQAAAGSIPAWVGAAYQFAQPTAFTVIFIFTLYALIRNFMRNREIAALDKKMRNADCECEGNCSNVEGDVDELKTLVKEAVEEKKSSKKSKSSKHSKDSKKE